MTEVVLPELGEGVSEAIIACYHHKVGDFIEKDDDVVEVVTDKATFNVPATSAGVLKKVYYQEGDKVPVGDKLFALESSS